MEIILICVIGVLGVVCFFLLFRQLILHREMKRTAEELRLNRESSYNRMLTVTLIDSSFNELVTEMNKSLDYQRSLKVGNEQTERRIKQSVSDIAHDLRTPLTVMKGCLQMIEAEELADERCAEYIRICSDKTDRLKKMADDFFEMSLLESEQSEAVIEKINATNLLMQFIADNEAVIRKHELVPDIRLPDKTVCLLGDQQLIIRVLENLLNNVVKYAVGGFRVELSGDDERCSITFANRAPKLTEADAERLFERTYRGDKARHGGGAGLGLYIVKLLMEKQGGDVSAELKDGELRLTAKFRGVRS